MRRIVLFGATGQLGRALCRNLERRTLHALTRDQCDITDTTAVTRVLNEIQPDVVINAAAYTDVEGAEHADAQAMAVNSDAAGFLARSAREMDALFVSYSTDYVFDGSANAPYDEASPTRPLNAYGRSKLAGEEAIHAAGGRYLIVRTAWLYSCDGSNFLKTVLRLAAEREELEFVSDQVGTPTSAAWLAQATSALLVRATNAEDASAVPGVVHAVSRGESSWYDFARAIIDGARNRGEELTVRQVRPIPTGMYPSLAKRPAYSVLSTRHLLEKWGVQAPLWQSMLATELDKLYCKNARC